VDHSGAVETVDRRGQGRLTLFLPRHPPSACFFWVGWIADIEDDQNLSFVAGHARGQIRVFASGIAVAMSAGRACLPPRDLLGIQRLTDIPDEDSFVYFLIRVAAVAGSILKRRDHEIAVEINLARGSGRWPRQELDDFWIRWVRFVDNAPTVGYEVAHVEIPAITHMFDRHL